jgi:hypothetical protein
VLILDYDMHICLSSLLQLPSFLSNLSSPSCALLRLHALRAWPKLLASLLPLCWPSTGGSSSVGLAGLTCLVCELHAAASEVQAKPWHVLM